MMNAGLFGFEMGADGPRLRICLAPAKSIHDAVIRVHGAGTLCIRHNALESFR